MELQRKRLGRPDAQSVAERTLEQLKDGAVVVFMIMLSGYLIHWK